MFIQSFKLFLNLSSRLHNLYLYTTAEIEFISLFFFLLWQVILRQSLYLGGVPTFEIVSPYIPVRVPFSGCIQKVSFE